MERSGTNSNEQNKRMKAEQQPLHRH